MLGGVEQDRGIRFNQRVVRGFAVFSRVVGGGAVVLGLALLLAGTGLFGSDLRALALAEFSLRADSALAAVLVGVALLACHRAPRLSLGASLLAALLGGFELAVHLGLLAPSGFRLLPWLPDAPGIHMTELAAVSFLLLGGVGLAVASGRSICLRDVLALTVIAIAMASCASYGLRLAGEDPNLLRRLPLAAALLFLLLALGWMSASPTTGLTRIAVADSLGGAFARRLILPSLLLPTLFTFLFAQVQLRCGLSESLLHALAALATGGTATTMIVWVAFLLDRSERQRRAVAALREDADTDALTGLANRRCFDAALEQALADPGMFPLALLMLDLDRFKSYNDSFGHPAGDEVLRDTGRLLRASVRPGDLVARYGGEEFVIVLRQGDEVSASRVGARVLDAFRTNDWPLRPVTISIGAAVAGALDTPQSLIDRADRALYASKQAGRDRMTLAAAD